FLAKAVKSQRYQRAFSYFKTIILTTYDSACITDIGTDSPRMIDPEWLDKNAQAVVNEYCEMTKVLYETQKDSRKLFIICNDENDNDILAVTYVTNPDARKKMDDDKVPPEKRFAGFVRWFLLRKQGIEAGQQWAANQHYSGVEVKDAIEFNSLYHIKDY